MLEELNYQEMSEIKGGVSREEYCRTLGTIMANNKLDDAAMEGARYGWNKYCA